MPQRSRVVTVVAHCHLDVNTRVHGLAECEGARPGVIVPLIASGHGIVQLPCPEATYLGLDRPRMTRERYDTPEYRRHCRELLAPVVTTLAALSADGCRIERVLGAAGSPSCETAGPGGSGILMQELGSMLLTAGLDVPFDQPDPSEG